MRILYVDDDADDHEIFAEALSAVNPSIELVGCFTVMEAARIISHQTFDYVFLDYRMPVADGNALLPLLFEMRQTARTKVIMISTHMSEAEIDDCRKSGADDCYSKTGNFDELCRLLSMILNESGQQPMTLSGN
jgi:CheY-like chemotaxis protein